jgi:hypothetical protein
MSRNNLNSIEAVAAVFNENRDVILEGAVEDLYFPS